MQKLKINRSTLPDEISVCDEVKKCPYDEKPQIKVGAIPQSRQTTSSYRFVEQADCSVCTAFFLLLCVSSMDTTHKDLS